MNNRFSRWDWQVHHIEVVFEGLAYIMRGLMQQLRQKTRTEYTEEVFDSWVETGRSLIRHLRERL